jgi:hypothetical protein
MLPIPARDRLPEHLPGYGRARRFVLPFCGNGCSYVLFVMPIGLSTHSRAICGKGLTDRVGQPSSSIITAPRILEAGHGRTLQSHTRKVGRTEAVENLNNRR